MFETIIENKNAPINTQNKKKKKIYQPRRKKTHSKWETICQFQWKTICQF